MSTELVEKVEMAAGHCPIRDCTGDLDYGSFEPADDGGYYPWRCLSCGATGKEWYDMSFSEHVLTGEPTPALGTGDRSQASMSMETRPKVRVSCPATAIGVPVGAWRG